MVGVDRSSDHDGLGDCAISRRCRCAYCPRSEDDLFIGLEHATWEVDIRLCASHVHLDMLSFWVTSSCIEVTFWFTPRTVIFC
jgi:hypothetical protein